MFIVYNNDSKIVYYILSEKPLLTNKEMKCSEFSAVDINLETHSVIEFECIKPDDFIDGKYIWNGNSLEVNSNYVQTNNIRSEK